MSRRDPVAIPLVATFVIHALFAAGLAFAERFVKPVRAPAPMEVTFEVKPAPPPPPVEEPPPPPPEPPKAAVEKPPPPKKVATVKRPPPPADEPPPEPAPGPPDEEPPAPQRVYVMPGSGTVYVNPGSAEGTSTGRPGGSGKGKGGGGDPLSTGSGPQVVPLSSVKKMPEALGDYDYNKDYPPEAQKQGVEGEVAVRILVDETGKAAQTKLARGLGFGLDQKALELARKIRFKPALDDGDRPVATWITWTFTFSLPR